MGIDHKMGEGQRHGDEETFDEWYKGADRSHKQYYRGRLKDLPEIDMMTSSAEEYFDLSQKPVADIIKKYKDFIKDLYDIEHIYVLGHSLNAVDIPYFQAVKDANDHPSAIHWHISYYLEEEKGELLCRYSTYLSSENTPVDMFRLEDMMMGN